MQQRVVVGLSGGVDSSVAAALLIDQGYDVTGAYISCWSGPGCRDEADRQDALDIALQLAIPFVHLDFRQEYKDKVYEYMMAEYAAGRTPNPDVMCNREIKFGLFYDWALAEGYQYVATGHYAQVINCNQQLNFGVLDCLKASGCVRQNSDCCLFRSVDGHKDQTYFLWQLRQEQLAHILFPIGHLTKPQVRAEAEKRGLLTAKKPDSQGICFIGEVSVAKFLEEQIEQKEGKICLLANNSLGLQPVSLNKGEVMEVGMHRGVWFYTIGQKIAIDQKKVRGFDKTNLPHFYVAKKDLEKNILYVGTKDQLYTNEMWVDQVHWITEEEVEAVRIRHGGELVPAELDGDKIKLEQPVWGVAAGQSVVFYRGKQVLGGGVISG